MSDKLKIMQTPIKKISNRKRNRRSRSRNLSEHGRAPITMNCFVEVNIIESSGVSSSSLDG